MVLRSVAVLAISFLFLTANAQTPAHADWQDVPGTGPGCEVDTSTGRCGTTTTLPSGTSRPPPIDCRIQDCRTDQERATDRDIAARRRAAEIAMGEGDFLMDRGYVSAAIRYYQEAVLHAPTNALRRDARRKLQQAERSNQESERLAETRDRNARNWSDSRCLAHSWCRTIALVQSEADWATQALGGTDSSGRSRIWWDTPGQDNGTLAVPIGLDRAPQRRSRIPSIPSSHTYRDRLVQLRDYVRAQDEQIETLRQQMPSDNNDYRVFALPSLRQNEIEAREAAREWAVDRMKCYVDASFNPSGTNASAASAPRCE